MKHNTMKRVLAATMSLLTVAAPMTANVQGIWQEIAIVAHAGDESAAGTLNIDNVKPYLVEVKIGTVSNSEFTYVHTYDVPADVTVTITTRAKLNTAGLSEPTFADGKWTYTYKQTSGEKTLNLADAPTITFVDDNNHIAKKITAWKIGNGGTGKEWTREKTDTSDVEIAGVKLGETLEITSTELLDFTPGVAFGIYNATTNPKPVRTVKNGTTLTYTYKFSAGNTKISKGTHQHEFEVVGLTEDKTALELRCSDTVDGTHTTPYSVYMTVFNLTKVPGNDVNAKLINVDNPTTSHVVLSELQERNFIYNHFDDNLAWGVYDNATEPTFHSAGGFINFTDDNVGATEESHVFTVGNKPYTIDKTPAIYDADGNVVLKVGEKYGDEAEAVSADNFTKHLNMLPVGSYTAKYNITNTLGGDDVIEEGGGNVTIGDGNTTSTKVYTLEMPFTVAQAEVTDEAFAIDKDTFSIDGAGKRTYLYEYDDNERFTPSVVNTAGLVEGRDYKIEGDLSASRVGEYSIFVIGLGNYDFEYELRWKIVDNVPAVDDKFRVLASKTYYGWSVYDAVADNLSYKSEDKVYTYYYKLKDQTDKVEDENEQDQFTSKEKWAANLALKGYKEITKETKLNAGEYTITVIAEDISYKNEDGTPVATRSYSDNFLKIEKMPIYLVINGGVTTFDGKSHIDEIASASVTAFAPYGYYAGYGVSDYAAVYGELTEAAKKLKIEAVSTFKFATEYANATDKEKESKEYLTAADQASVTHAGVYQLKITDASLKALKDKYGNNYDFEGASADDDDDDDDASGYNPLSEENYEQLKTAMIWAQSVPMYQMAVSEYLTGVFVINPATVHAELSKNTYVYSGRLIKPSFTVSGVDGTVLKEGVDYTVEGAKSAKGLETKDTQFYTIINGKGDYAFSKDAFNWRIINNSALRGAAAVTYQDTTSVLKEGKQRVTYKIDRKLLPAAPEGTKITAIGAIYYNGMDAMTVNAEMLLKKVGTYVTDRDKVNIVKTARQANPSAQNGTLTLNILDNGYGTAVLGFVEVTDKDGNTATIFGKKVNDEGVTIEQPYALIETYASANIEAEKAIQENVSVSYNGAVNDKLATLYRVKDGKDQVSFRFDRSVDDALDAKYDVKVTEYGVYYYNGLNDITESALTNQWVGKAPAGETKNSDTTNVVKQAHVLASSSGITQDSMRNGTLTVHVADNGNSVHSRGYMCVAVYKKGTMNNANAQPLYQTTVYSANDYDDSDTKPAKWFDEAKELEVYQNSVTTLNYDALVKTEITSDEDHTIKIDSQTASKQDNGQTVTVTISDTHVDHQNDNGGTIKGFDVVGYGAIYTTNADATAADLTLDKVNGSTVKKVEIAKNLTDAVGHSGSVIVEGDTNKKYRTFILAKDELGNHTVLYANEAGAFVETSN